MSITSALILAIALSVGLVAAAPIERQQPPAGPLRRVVGLVHKGEQPSVDDVLEAYKEYVRYHKLKTNLTTDYEKADKMEASETEYQQIGRILSAPGIEQVVEELFYPLDPDREVTKHQRAKIEQAIQRLVKPSPNWAQLSNLPG